MTRWVDQPLAFVFERKSPTDRSDAKAETITLTLPPNQFVDFGIRLAMEPIASIQSGGPADRAGFRKGDRIVKFDDSEDPVDPMRLPTQVAASAGRPMTFDVERAEPGQEKRKIVQLTATPDDSPPWTEPVRPGEPLEVPGLGLAYHVLPHVLEVLPDSPAEKAGLKKGDTITTLIFPASKDPKAKELGMDQPETIEFKEESPDWASAFYALQSRPLQAVQVTVNHSTTPISITPEPVSGWHHPLRGLLFQGLMRKLPPQSAIVALRRGSEDTIDNILSIYAMLRSLAQGRVSPKAMAGPLKIPQIAYASAASGWTYLIHFLGVLSINLAVLNFLPIPPLDGGQMAFLIAEKIRGRPLPDSAVIVGSWMGLLLVVALMVFVLYQDVAQLLTG
jgi:regulator of sigma E protease